MSHYRVALLADFNPDSETHQATQLSLQHSATTLGVSVLGKWVSTAEMSIERMSEFDGLWVGTGGPFKNLTNALRAIRFSRENGIPTLGTCGGFQHIIIELARNVMGYQAAAHAEYDPYSPELFITALDCSLAGRTMRITLAPGSLARALYEISEVDEQYYCNFGVNPRYVQELKESAIRVSGSDNEGEVRIVEIVDHPFFLGTLFVPQVRSSASEPHPIINGFVQSLAEQRSVK